MPCIINKTFELPTPNDTDLLGVSFANSCAQLKDTIKEKGLAIRLEGNLGAGKTSFVRAFLRALNFTGAVKSPTFTLLESYPVIGLEVNHFDFYRFEDPLEFEDAGFEEMFGPGFITFTEWSQKVGELLPDADITIEISVIGSGRLFTFIPLTELGLSIVGNLTHNKN